jgi:hypothetical protein
MESSKRVTLTLRNPSDAWRDGFVVRKWEPVAELLGGAPKAARVYRRVVKDDRDPPEVRPLLAQVDVLDPEAGARTQLVFDVGGPVKPGDDQYNTPCATVEIDAADENEPARDARVEGFFTGAKLWNDHLEIWVNTSKKRDDGVPGDFFAGSVPYVRLKKYDDLDALDVIGSRYSWDRHPEQRAMQIDRIHLVRPPWDEDGSFDNVPYRDHWRLVSTSEGPVRATATIASSSFEFECRDANDRKRVYECAVYRTISVYSGQEYIGDEVWVKATDLTTKKARRLWFSGGYFMMVQFTVDQCVFRYPDHPGWFTISSVNEPRQGYGFATDSRASALWNPPLDYSDRETEHRAYAWELGASRAAHSYHLFGVDTAQQKFTDTVGLLWYHLVFKRLRATLENEQ